MKLFIKAWNQNVCIFGRLLSLLPHLCRSGAQVCSQSTRSPLRFFAGLSIFSLSFSSLSPTFTTLYFFLFFFLFVVPGQSLSSDVLSVSYRCMVSTNSRLLCDSSRLFATALHFSTAPRLRFRQTIVLEALRQGICWYYLLLLGSSCFRVIQENRFVNSFTQ